MIVIHIGRKPLIGSVAKNVLQHGTGGINIGACRIGSEVGGWRGGGGALSGWDRSMPAGAARPVSGRWPANFVLEHDPRCCLKGVELRNASELEGLEIPQYQEDWDCVDGCPAKETRQQKGSPDFFLQVQNKIR